jgi:hypothetical protein
MSYSDLPLHRSYDLTILITIKRPTQTGRIKARLKGRIKEETKDKTKEGTIT